MKLIKTTGLLLNAGNTLEQWRVAFWISAAIYVAGWIGFQVSPARDYIRPRVYIFTVGVAVRSTRGVWDARERDFFTFWVWETINCSIELAKPYKWVFHLVLFFSCRQRGH